MKEINIFLASSIDEFKYERLDLGDFIRRVTDFTIEQDIYLKFTICEDMSNAVAKSRKQEEFNREIRNSDFFYVIFGNKAGDYTIEELDVAAQHFKKTERPYIYVYFQKPAEDTAVTENGKAVLERIKKEDIGISYRNYSHIDNMKLDIVRDLIREKAFNGIITIVKEKVLLNGKKLYVTEALSHENHKNHYGNCR